MQINIDNMKYVYVLIRLSNVFKQKNVRCVTLDISSWNLKMKHSLVTEEQIDYVV